MAYDWPGFAMPPGPSQGQRSGWLRSGSAFETYLIIANTECIIIGISMKTSILSRTTGSLCRRSATAPCLAVLGLVFALFLLGCNQVENEVTSATRETQATPATPARSITVFTYPQYLRSDVLRDFETSTGISVRYETFDTFSEMRFKLVSNPGAYDVLIADGGRNAVELRDLKLIQPFQTRKLFGLEHLDPRFGVFKTPKTLYVPYLWGFNLAAYRTDKLALKEEEKKWALFWDERVRGRAALIEEPVDIFAVGLASLGLAAHSQDATDNQRAEAHLRHAIEKNGVLLGNCWTNLDRLTSGECWLVHCYSGDAAMCAVDHENIDYFLPKEGAQLWVDGFLLASDSNQVEEAHQFVTFMLRPEVAARCADYALELTANRAALPLISSKLLGNRVLNPPAEVLDRCSIVPAVDRRELSGTLQLGLRNLQEAAHAMELEKVSGAASRSTPGIATPSLTVVSPR